MQIEINNQKFMTLKIMYYNGKMETVRCVSKVCNLRDKYLYYEQAFDLAGKGTSVERTKIRQWQVSL